MPLQTPTDEPDEFKSSKSASKEERIARNASSSKNGSLKSRNASRNAMLPAGKEKGWRSGIFQASFPKAFFGNGLLFQTRSPSAQQASALDPQQDSSQVFRELDGVSFCDLRFERRLHCTSQLLMRS